MASSRRLFRLGPGLTEFATDRPNACLRQPRQSVLHLRRIHIFRRRGLHPVERSTQSPSARTRHSARWRSLRRGFAETDFHICVQLSELHLHTAFRNFTAKPTSSRLTKHSPHYGTASPKRMFLSGTDPTEISSSSMPDARTSAVPTRSLSSAPRWLKKAPTPKSPATAQPSLAASKPCKLLARFGEVFSEAS